MQPKFSVIIPVYNTAEFLEKCLRSILNQDIKDIEILVVDDASTDNSVEIVEKLRNTDKRIILNKFEYNQNQASARNWGIQHATGDYILFVDSDDFLEPNVLKSLYDQVVVDDLDILEARHFRLSDSQVTEFPINFIPVNEVLPGGKYWKKAGNISVMVWNKVWKRELLIENKILYADRKFEDEDFVVRAIMNAERVKNTELFIYNYLIRPNSTMTSGATIDKIRGYIGLTLELDRLYSLATTLEMKEGIQKLLNYNFLNGPLYFEDTENKEIREYLLNFKKVYKKYRWRILTNKPTKISLRILVFLNPFLANKFYTKFRPW